MSDDPSDVPEDIKSKLFFGDVEVVFGSFAIFLATFQTIGRGGALALAATVLLIHGILREVGSQNSWLRAWISARSLDWVRKSRVGWMFISLGLALLLFSFVLWQLGKLEFHAIRVPIQKDYHSGLLGLSSHFQVGDVTTANEYATFRELLLKSEERLLPYVASGMRLGSKSNSPVIVTSDANGVKNQQPSQPRVYVMRTVELTERYLPFDLTIGLRNDHRCIAFEAMQLEQDQAGAFSKISLLRASVTNDAIIIEVDSPKPNTQIALVAVVAREDRVSLPSSKLDEVFTRTSFIIR